MKRTSRKGSALVGAIWLLAVQSILIVSYTVDAHRRTRINHDLRERVTVDHLTDAGLAIAEVILTGYQNVPEVTDEGDYEKQLEDDRWYAEKLMLKAQGGKEVTTGAVPVDALNPDGGTVTVTIRPIESKFNINNLYAGGDPNFGEIWMRILAVSGIPTEYWDGIVNGWCDWRDADEVVTGNKLNTKNIKNVSAEDRLGAESEFYTQAYQDFIDGKGVEKNKNYKPKARNGEIVDIEELKAIKGFNEYDEKPINADAILDGGVLNPSADEKEWITVTNGISRFFSVYGSGKINVNAVKDPLVLAVIPGIYPAEGDPEDPRPEDIEEAMAIAKRIIELRDAPPKDGKNPLFRSSDDEDRDTGAYKDFNDLQERLQRDRVDIQNEASQYLTFQPDKFFEVTIVGRSFGIVHKIVAVATVADGKVRYLRWQEDPRVDYVTELVANALRSAYFPTSGDTSYADGFMLLDQNENNNPDESDVISWTKLGPAIVGHNSRFSRSPHRVTLFVRSERDADEEHPSGLIAKVMGEDKFRPDDFNEDDEDNWDWFLLGPQVQGFNCRVLDKDEPFKSDMANWQDTWDTSNCIPRRVQLTFWMKPIDEDKDPYPVVRVVELPLWDISQNPLKTDSTASGGGKGDGKKTSGGKGGSGGGKGNGGGGGGGPGGPGGGPRGPGVAPPGGGGPMG